MNDDALRVGFDHLNATLGALAVPMMDAVREFASRLGQVFPRTGSEEMLGGSRAMVRAASLPRREERVTVPWGPDTVEATVERVYTSGESARVTVRVPVKGPGGDVLDEYTTVTLPLEQIDCVPA